MARATGMMRLLALSLSAGTLTAQFAAQAVAQAVAQTAPAPTPVPQTPTESETLTVTGTRLPSAEAPRSSTCEILSRDPRYRALIEASGGDPLLGPSLYVPTRYPRNPDYSAPPAVPAGSPLPELPRTRFGAPTLVINDVTTAAPLASSVPSSIALETDQVTGQFSPDQFTLDRAIDACRGAYVAGRGAAPVSAGNDRGLGAAGAYAAQDAQFAGRRSEIARNDKTLPMAFALFDQGRYAESLTRFRDAFSKLSFRDGGDEAALFVGKLQLQGLGDKSDPVEGVKWLKRAATAPFNPTIETPIFDPKQPGRNTATGEAAIILGNLYRVGFAGVPKDLAEARKWYDRAADVGHVPAAKMLGDIYYKGVDAPRDVKKALSYYRQAAKLNHAAAQVALADILYQGEDGIPQDRKTALDWYQAAAKTGHPDALYALAHAHDVGEGVKADPQLAIGFYKSAALQGNNAAKAALGTYFYEGKLIAKDDALARRWFEQAAIAKEPDAMLNLAAMLARGEGGPKDMTKALVWARLAQTLGNTNATRALTALEQRVTVDEKQAANLIVAAN